MDAVPTTAAKIACGLLDMYAAIEANAYFTTYINDAPFNLARRWHSSPARLRPLELALNVKHVFGLGCPRIDRACRIMKPEYVQPSYSAPFFFTLEIGQGGDPFTTQTRNCVLRYLSIARLAFLAVLRDAGIEHGIDVERLKTAYRERVERRETTPFAINVRLSPVGVDAVCRIRDAVHRFLNLSDGEVFEHGSSIGFTGIRFLY